MSSARQPIVSARDLAVSYIRWGQTVTALDRVSLDIFPGEWILLVGPNGAGKSTLLAAISGRVPLDAGKVTINGKNLLALKPSQLARMLFTVHQDPLLGTAPLLTVFENLLVADATGRQGWTSKSNTMHRYASLLAPIGLDGRLKQPAKVLSGGERQLLALVIARLRATPVILLDEPFAALDPARTQLCVKEIAAMHREGKTIVQIAHDTRLVQALADRTFTLEGGKLQSLAKTQIPISGGRKTTSDWRS